MNDDDEAVLHLRKEDEPSGTVIPLRYAESLVPNTETEYKITLTFADKPANVERKIGQTESTAELRADFYGTRYSPSFVLREIENDNLNKRKGKFSIEEPEVIEEFDLVDTTKEKILDHTEKPHESCYVTIEFESIN
jgi:hypothetical protein